MWAEIVVQVEATPNTHKQPCGRKEVPIGGGNTLERSPL